MNGNHKPTPAPCPATATALLVEARQQFEHLLVFCEKNEDAFFEFEKSLLVLMSVFGRVLVRLFLTARQERLDLQSYREDRVYELGDGYAERTVKTAYGVVRYGRAQMLPRRGGAGFYPLDAALGLTRDHLSPWVMQLVGRLATRLSFGATRLVCQAALQWSPATETIEQVVLGLGRQAAPFMEQLLAPSSEGEVLVIEADGKCPPTATEAELAKRRGHRRPRAGCSCGCQRHRGQRQRRVRGSKKRHQRGDKHKNGKEVTVLVLYTLKRGTDGKLHGPRHKKVWATFAGRKAGATWARAEATRRGFGPGTIQTVQIVLDGAQSLKNYLEPLFPHAIFTLDICHVVEKLWSLGHHFHPEGSKKLKRWVEDLKTFVYDGRAAQLVERLRGYWRKESMHGPGTLSRRRALEQLIGYLEPRLSMMRYREWIDQDLVIATGQVEGAVRHIVGERFDCSGMRWTPGKAEPLLHLRCIELNGDWDRFFAWAHERCHEQLRQRQRVRILTDQPMQVARAA
jgi:hypothetical protein